MPKEAISGVSDSKQQRLYFVADLFGAEFLEEAGVEVARVVHQGVDAAKLLDGGPNCGLGVLGISPSALSQAIRHLEARLGVRLLNRTTRSVSLTEAGDAYLSRIGPALSEMQEAREHFHALRGQPSRVLRINAARISTAMVLQPLLAGFSRASPDVSVEYEVGGNITITDSLFSIDAALAGVGLAYTSEQHALPHIRAKRLKRVLGSFSPTFSGFYLYYTSRRQQPSRMKVFVDYARALSRKRLADWNARFFGGQRPAQGRPVVHPECGRRIREFLRPLRNRAIPGHAATAEPPPNCCGGLPSTWRLPRRNARCGAYRSPARTRRRGADAARRCRRRATSRPRQQAPSPRTDACAYRAPATAATCVPVPRRSPGPSRRRYLHCDHLWRLRWRRTVD